jgi:hypothetical protein
MEFHVEEASNAKEEIAGPKADRRGMVDDFDVEVRNKNRLRNRRRRQIHIGGSTKGRLICHATF